MLCIREAVYSNSIVSQTVWVDDRYVELYIHIHTYSVYNSGFERGPDNKSTENSGARDSRPPFR